MILNNAKILNIVNAYQKGTDLKLPPVLAWKRRVNMQEMIRVKGIIDEALAEIRKNYTDDEHSKDLGNGIREVFPEYYNDYIKAQDELLNLDTEVSIEVVKVNLSDLGNAPISDNDLETLAFMIEVKDED